MAYNMILTPEQEQRRKDSKQALESLKYNPMCYGCKKLCAGCGGTIEKLWDGCLRYFLEQQIIAAEIAKEKAY